MNIVNKNEYDKIERFNKYTLVAKMDKKNKLLKWGVIDKNANKLIPCKYDKDDIVLVNNTISFKI